MDDKFDLGEGGLPKAGIGFINCDDEEDCIQGSGSGDGLHPGLNGGGDYGSRSSYTGSNDNGGTSSNTGSSDEDYWAGGTDSKCF